MHKRLISRALLLAAVFLVVTACTELPVTTGDLYLESWTALQAYKHGKFTYIPADKRITVNVTNDGQKLKITANSIIDDSKTALTLTYPNECLQPKHKACLSGANNEYRALSECFEKAINGEDATGSCSVSMFVFNGTTGLLVKNPKDAPHMEIWVDDDD